MTTTTTNNSSRYGLMIAPAWVGDAVMAQVLLKFLIEQHADLVLDVAAPPALVPLFERMPQVRQIFELPFKHGEFSLFKRIALGRSLRQQHYDYAWVLPNSWKSAIVPFFAGAKQRIGWRGEMRYLLLNDIRKLDKQRLPLMAQRFFTLGWSKARWQQWVAQSTTMADEQNFVEHYPQLLPAMQVSEEQRQASCQAVNFQPTDKPLLALCPGAAYGWSKRWLPNYFADVANHYLQHGFDVAIFGSHDDQVTADTIMTQTQQRCHNFTGRTTLAQAIDLLSLTDVVLTNDSGLMHIACALNRRVVAIYGSSSPKFTPPLGRQVAICYLDLECSPCFARDCPLKHFRCMRDLLPQQVIAAIDKLYSQPLENLV